MDAFAEVSDVTAVSASLTSDQEAAVAGLLAQASTKLRAWGLERGVSVDALVRDDELRAEIAKLAVVNATKRALGVLSGATEISTAIDDFREVIRHDKDTVLAGIYIDGGDLVGLLQKRPSRFGTLKLGSAL